MENCDSRAWVNLSPEPNVMLVIRIKKLINSKSTYDLKNVAKELKIE